MRSMFTAVLLSLALMGCGSGAPSAVSASAGGANLEVLPATVEGQLVIEVAEGDVEEGGASAFNFGTLTVDGQEIAIEVDGSVMSAAGVPEEGGKARAVLGSKSDQYGLMTYKITSLTKL